MGKRGPRPNLAKRAEILSLRAEGLALEEIAARLDITRQRVHQILRKAVDANLAGAPMSPSRKLQIRRAASRRCEHCGKRRMAIGKGSRTLCAECRKLHNARTRETKRELATLGLCVNCRGLRDRDGRLCDKCLQEYNRRYR